MKIKKYIEEIETKDENVKYKVYVKIQIKPFLFIFPDYKFYILNEFSPNKYDLRRNGYQIEFHKYYQAVEALNEAIERFVKDYNSQKIVKKTKRLII